MNHIRKEAKEINRLLEQNILEHVEKPGRYTGKEYNEIRKINCSRMVKIALAFPDLYEIGMSYLGFKILYDIINKREDALAERVFSPARDMEQLMTKEKIPLFSLESRTPLYDFDILGFSLQHELSFTNVLHIIDLGGISLYSKERTSEDPLIIAGGPSAFNPEPLADFIDAFIIGDGEEIISDIINEYKSWEHSESKKNKIDLLQKLMYIPGIYIPSFYSVSYFDDGRIKSIKKREKDAPLKIKKRILKDLSKSSFPISPIVPNIDIVHNRITLEIFRGCTRGCRFCQAGIIYRPVRERPVNVLLTLADKSLMNTGYEEISLSSLSSSDYNGIDCLIEGLVDRYRDQGVSVSLPSLRVDNFSIELARQTQRVRKTGLTFAPEVGTDRLSKTINKNVTGDDLYQSVQMACKEGWRRIKLYFMIGLPTETWDDINGIIKMVKKVEQIGKGIAGNKFTLNISINAFVPKAHTPFQWVGQEKEEDLLKKYKTIIRNIKTKNISSHFPDTKASLLEAVFARGDRRLGKVLLDAYKKGCRFDSWRESFNFDEWINSFQKNNLTMEFYAYRQRGKEEVMPWDRIDSGVDREYLWHEWKKAETAAITNDCRLAECNHCGLEGICNISIGKSDC